MKGKLTVLFIFNIILIIINYYSIQCSGSRIFSVSLNKETVMEAGLAGQPITAYYMDTNIGTPGKKFKMLIDLNAKETWLPHNLALSFVYNRLHYNIGYSKKDSISSSKENKEFSFDYLGCILTGKAYEDLIKFENITQLNQNNSNSVSFRQRFLAISSASNGNLKDYPTDGVLSLNPSVLSETGTRSLLINMNQNQLIDELKFSLYLDNNLDTNYGGELMFGGLNPTKYIGTIYYHTLNNYHNDIKWELKLQNVMLGGQVVSCNQNSNGCSAILSTNLNDLYGPDEDVRKIMTLLGVSKKKDLLREKENRNYNEIHEIECLRITELPLITFNIEGISYTVPPSMYIKKKVDGLLFKTSTCYVTIFSNNNSNDQWILGTNFLSNYYTVFDFNRRQVGFGAKKIIKL